MIVVNTASSSDVSAFPSNANVAEDGLVELGRHLFIVEGRRLKRLELGRGGCRRPGRLAVARSPRGDDRSACFVVALEAIPKTLALAKPTPTLTPPPIPSGALKALNSARVFAVRYEVAASPGAAAAPLA